MAHTSASHRKVACEGVIIDTDRYNGYAVGIRRVGDAAPGIIVQISAPVPTGIGSGIARYAFMNVEAGGGAGRQTDHCSLDDNTRAV